MSADAQLSIEPRVQLELSLEEAHSLLAWLIHTNDDGLNPPVAHELAHALEQALEVQPMG